MPQPLCSWGKGPQYLLDMRMGGLQCQFARSGKEEKIPVPGQESPHKF